MAVEDRGMYVNRPLDAYIIGVARTEGIDFRDRQTPSYFHRFLLPPSIFQKDMNKYFWKYYTPVVDKPQIYENCYEIRQICKKCPGYNYEKHTDRAWHDIENPTKLIETSDDFIIQFQNTIRFVKVMVCVCVFVIILKILLVMSTNLANK